MKQPQLKIASEPFEAKFAKSGQLRQKVGRSGRVHLDRWLPFLVLNRSEGPSVSIARRIAVNSPAYLIWSAEDDIAAASALDSVLVQLRRQFGRVLLITLEDGAIHETAEHSQNLEPFVAQVAAAGSGRASEALSALAGSLGEVEIDLRRADVRQGELLSPEIVDQAVGGLDEIDRLSLLVPQIHRSPDGRIYPQITHDLAVAFGDALLCAACAFLKGSRIGAPSHYRSLGRSAFLAAARHADRKLDSIARSFDFLLALSPINTAEAMKRFFEAGEDRAPELRYRPIAIDPDDAKRDLYRIDLSLLEDPLLERLLKEKRLELDYQLTMLATRNTPAFRPASLLLYGSIDPELLLEARAILAATGPRPRAGEMVDAGEMARAARALIASYRSIDTSFDPKVEVRDDVAGVLVSGGKLLIPSNLAMAKIRVDPLLAHEVSVHLLTYFNGATQGLTVFRTGLAHYEGAQEGLGVFAEWAVGGLTVPRFRVLAGRVVAVDSMLRGADFIEVYRLLTSELGFGREVAFDITARVFRSGGLAKDAIYLKGFRLVVARVAAGASLAPFWLGKIAPEHVSAIEDLLQRRLLHAPVFQPEFLARDDAQRRIGVLGAGLPFNRILEVDQAT